MQARSLDSQRQSALVLASLLQNQQYLTPGLGHVDGRSLGGNDLLFNKRHIS